MPPPPRNPIERDDEPPRLMLSMRAKVTIVGLCFVLGMSFFVYTNVPYAVRALRSIASDATSETGQEYVTLFRDDFDVQNPHWSIWYTDERKSLRDGYLFINLTPGNNLGGFSHQVQFNDLSTDTSPHPWLYANMEIKLKIHDDGILQDGLGYGNKWWGFKDSGLEWMGGENLLQFSTYSHSSDPPYTGFWAQVFPGIPDTENENESLYPLYNEAINPAEITLNQWHTYRFIWRPNNGTLIIDGKTIATTSSVPTVPMGINLHLHDIVRHGSDWNGYNYIYDYESTRHNVSMQVDYIHVFVPKEYFDEMDAEVSAFFSEAQELIQQLANRDENTTHLENYYNQAHNLWREGHYLYMPAKALLIPFMEALYNFDEIKEMFFQAETAIATLYDQGDNRTAQTCEAQLNTARNLWEDCDYESTKTYLQNIQTSVTETSLLTSLSLIITSILLTKSRHLT